MSVSSVPAKVRILLWGKAAGRCQYRGCNKKLYRDATTGAEFNTSYIAHIVADEPTGPRGDPVRSKLLKKELSNLMLLCDIHHRMVDILDVGGHPEDCLVGMKLEHEERCEECTEPGPELRTELLLYGAKVGEQSSPVTESQAKRAVLPTRYPSTAAKFQFSLENLALQDRDESYWLAEEASLRRHFSLQVRPRVGDRSVEHISVFALAPQPLLVLLGSLLSDIREVDVFQLHREPRGWRWLSETTLAMPELVSPSSVDHTMLPCLTLELSGNINRDRLERVLGLDLAVWRLTCAEPGGDWLTTREQLTEFRRLARKAMEEIKDAFGTETPVHLFPAGPVAASVELGRVLMPKVHPPIVCYDEQQVIGFQKTITVVGAGGDT